MYGRKKIGFLINRDHIERERERRENGEKMGIYKEEEDEGGRGVKININYD